MSYCERPNWWYEPDAEIEYVCKDCQKHEIDKDEISCALNKIVDQLKKSDRFDDSKLNAALFQIAWIIGDSALEKKLDQAILDEKTV